MTKAKAESVEQEVTQEAPTAAPKRDKNGFELDGWDLPVSGPARAARLEELGKPDPHEDPKAWKKQAVTMLGVDVTTQNTNTES
jgi:hypothetical protein